MTHTLSPSMMDSFLAHSQDEITVMSTMLRIVRDPRLRQMINRQISDHQRSKIVWKEVWKLDSQKSPNEAAMDRVQQEAYALADSIDTRCHLFQLSVDFCKSLHIAERKCGKSSGVLNCRGPQFLEWTK